MKILPYGRQTIDDDDVEAVLKVLRSDFLTTGPEIDAFEASVAERVQAKYAVSVSSATAALHLAVLALNLEGESEAIIPTNTFLATANAVVYCGHTPIFCDVDSKTYCMRASDLEEKISEKTKVAIPVHFAGRACSMEEIAALAKKSGITIIEDAAHALGSRYENGKPVGSCCYSAMTIFSFHPVKTVTSGEGGVITTNDEALYRKLISLRSHGMTSVKNECLQSKMAIDPASGEQNSWYYEMQQVGYNYRLSALHAALGRSQMKKLSSFLERRREIVESYNEAFRANEYIQTPVSGGDNYTGWHLYVIQIAFQKLAISRHEVMKHLRENGIGTQVHYIPVHLQPFYRETYGYKEGDFPNAEAYYEGALSLPLFPAMSDKDVHFVIQGVQKVLEGGKC